MSKKKSKPEFNVEEFIKNNPCGEDDTPEPLSGHPEFYSILKELKELHNAKNHDYAAGGRPLGNFERVACILSMYPGLSPADPFVVSIIYSLKQLDAALWLRSNGHTANVEGIADRMKDVAVYSIIEMILAGE